MLTWVNDLVTRKDPMICIYCPGDTKVTNSRAQRGGKAIWRRRHCTVCGTIFTTNEVPDLNATIRVQKQNEELEPFSRDVLFYSIAASCGHRKQSALTDAAALTDTVITLLLSERSALITTDDLRTMVLLTLERFDKAAASYYRAYFI